MWTWRSLEKIMSQTPREAQGVQKNGVGILAVWTGREVARLVDTGLCFRVCRDPCMIVPMSYRRSSDGAGGARAGCEHEGGGGGLTGGGADPGQIKRLLRCKEALEMGDQTFEEVPIPTSSGLCPGTAQSWEVAGRIDSAFQAALSLHL